MAAFVFAYLDMKADWKLSGGLELRQEPRRRPFRIAVPVVPIG